MKSILVTGGCGFIGSHTCISLLENNFHLIIIDSNINSSSKVLKKIIEIGKSNKLNFKNKLDFIKGDIRDKNVLERIFTKALKNKKPIDAVIHFAGLKAVSESVLKPLLYWENNVLGSMILFSVMDKFDCKNLVFSSSATVYKSFNKQILLDENIDLKPSNPYGNTKLSIEKILNDLFLSSNNSWRIINLRYFNPIGAHPSGLIGEDPCDYPNNLFPYICKVANKNIKLLNIFGNDWPTPDGTCIRDYIHVMDLADAHVKALNFLFENKAQILNLNIGTRKGTSVLELVKTFISVNGCDINYKFTDRRKGDVPFLVADNKLATSLICWNPRRNLEDMCRDGWKWQKLNPNGFKNF